mgnify:CR=1 FL=1
MSLVLEDEFVHPMGSADVVTQFVNRYVLVSVEGEIDVAQPELVVELDEAETVVDVTPTAMLVEVDHVELTVEIEIE